MTSLKNLQDTFKWRGVFNYQKQRVGNEHSYDKSDNDGR